MNEIKEKTQRYLDAPLNLRLRDLSVLPDDSGWLSYNPKDKNYNRCNQMSAYLFNRWILKLPSDRTSRFYAALQNILGEFYQSGQLGLIFYNSGTTKSNQLFIKYLEEKLSEAFPNTYIYL